MYDEALWRKCIEFHGHECPGLAIGYAAAMAAREILECGSSEDEEIVCVCENDACGVDAIQVLLGCSAGKGNLILRVTGKQVYSVYDRRSGESVRLSMRDTLNAETREEKIGLLLNMPWHLLFEAGKPEYDIPENAKIFKSYPCAACKESTAEFALTEQDGKLLCPDCYKKLHL